MKRFRTQVLAVGGLLVLTACGSTVPVGQQGIVARNGGLATPGVTADGGTPEVPGAVPGGAVNGSSHGGGPNSQPGQGGTSTSGAVDSSGPNAVTPGRGTTKPLQIGVIVTDTETFQKANGAMSYTSMTRDSLHAFIKAINAAGGIAGRRLEVVDFTFPYTAAVYDNEFEAACQKFTKDNHVGAVIYDGVTYNQVFNSRLTKAGVPSFFMHQVGTQIGDDTDMAKNPGLITAGSVSVDRRIRAILNGALRQGFLRSGSKLGVIVETCSYSTRAYDRTLMPIVKRNKIAVFRTDVDCGAGSADHGTGIAAVQAAVLRYQSSGVDSVMFLTNYENGSIAFFAQAAEAQQWHPQFLLWHNQGAPGYRDYYKNNGMTAQLYKMRAFGGSVLWDVTYPPAPPPAQAALRKACLTTAKRQGLAPQGLDMQYIVLDACDAVNLLARALTLTGGQAGIRAIVPAVERLGTGFVSTMVLNGATRFGPGLHDGLAMGAVSVYQAKCDCFVFITPPRPLA